MDILHISKTMGQGYAEKTVFQLCCNNNFEKNIVASAGSDYSEQLKKVSEYKDKLIGLSEKLGIQENVVFLGYRSDVFQL